MTFRGARPFRVAAIVAGAVALLLVGILIGGHPSWLPSPIRSAFVADDGSGVVGQALDLLTKDYYRPLSRSQLANKGVAGAVASLNDPFSHYFDPSDYRDFAETENPHLSGVGIVVDLAAQGLKVDEVYPGTPAARAGLVAGDLIVAVGDTSLAGRDAGFGSRLIKGKAGTAVRLSIRRGKQTRTVTVRRADIVVPVAQGQIATVHGTRLGIVQLTTFSDGSGDQVRAQVRSVLARGAKGIILDLRQNGGGLLQEAVNVASIFLADGTVVSTEGRDQPRQVYVAKGNPIAPRIPLVVLVDNGTASAAEIVTAALKDRGRAKVVGTRTYGKGVFQELETLSNGGALDIVSGRWFRPDGGNVGGPGVTRGTGIQPDVKAALRVKTGRDQPLDTAESTVLGELGG
jgi:carboxyl-terminal processing protease